MCFVRGGGETVCTYFVYAHEGLGWDGLGGEVLRNKRKVLLKNTKSPLVNSVPFGTNDRGGPWVNPQPCSPTYISWFASEKKRRGERVRERGRRQGVIDIKKG